MTILTDVDRPNVLHLQHPIADDETIAALRFLLSEAVAGRVNGLAYVALKPAGHYCGDVVGSAAQHPLLTRGICRTLEDQVAAKIL